MQSGLSFDSQGRKGFRCSVFQFKYNTSTVYLVLKKFLICTKDSDNNSVCSWNITTHSRDFVLYAIRSYECSYRHQKHTMTEIYGSIKKGSDIFLYWNQINPHTSNLWHCCCCFLCLRTTNLKIIVIHQYTRFC